MSIATAKPSALEPSTYQPVRPSQSPCWPSPSPIRRNARSGTAPSYSCANCEMELVGRPTIHVGVAFCCAGCAAGGPCTCSYDEGLETEPQPSVGWKVRECLDVGVFDGARQTTRSR